MQRQNHDNATTVPIGVVNVPSVRQHIRCRTDRPSVVAAAATTTTTTTTTTIATTTSVCLLVVLFRVYWWTARNAKTGTEVHTGWNNSKSSLPRPNWRGIRFMCNIQFSLSRWCLGVMRIIKPLTHAPQTGARKYLARYIRVIFNSLLCGSLNMMLI